MADVPTGAFCAHLRMQECHEDCGHWSCPDCDLEWDEGAWGPWPEDLEPMTEEDWVA